MLTLKNAARALALVGSLVGLSAVVAADVAQAQDEVVRERLDDSALLTKRTKVKPMRLAKHEASDDSRVEELGLEPRPVKPLKKTKSKKRITFGRFEGY